MDPMAPTALAVPNQLMDRIGSGLSILRDHGKKFQKVHLFYFLSTYYVNIPFVYVTIFFTFPHLISLKDSRWNLKSKCQAVNVKQWLKGLLRLNFILTSSLFFKLFGLFNLQEVNYHFTLRVFTQRKATQAYLL